MSDALTEFLLARIAEDEVAVERSDDFVAEGKWGRTRVLTECEAKRRIVALGPSRCSGYDDPPDIEPSMRMKHYPDPDKAGFCDGCAAAESSDDVWLSALVALAQPYAEHPDCREVWRL